MPIRRFGSRSALQSLIKSADSDAISVPIRIKHVHSISHTNRRPVEKIRTAWP